MYVGFIYRNLPTHMNFMADESGVSLYFAQFVNDWALCYNTHAMK